MVPSRCFGGVEPGKKFGRAAAETANKPERVERDTSRRRARDNFRLRDLRKSVGSRYLRYNFWGEWDNFCPLSSGKNAR